MGGLYGRIIRITISGAFLGAVVVAGTPGYIAAADAAVLPPQVAADLETTLQTQDDVNFLDALQALVDKSPEFACEIAAAATQGRPGLAVDIFLAVIEIVPDEAGDCADAVADAAPDLAEAVYAELSNIQTAGKKGPKPPPHVRRILKGTLENPNVTSPSG